MNGTDQSDNVRIPKSKSILKSIPLKEISKSKTEYEKSGIII